MTTKKWSRTGYVTKATPSERGVWVVYSDMLADPLPDQTRVPFAVGQADIYYGAPQDHGTWPNVYYLTAERRELNHEAVHGEHKTRVEAEAAMAERYQMREDGIPV